MNIAPDRDQMRRAIDVLHLPAAVIELRALHQKGRKYTTAGYFDAEHREQLIDEAMRLNSQGAAVYVVMNPLDPQLLARHANRTQDYASATATDSNVLRRHWLLIDVDPQRPRDTSATGEQLEAAKERARRVYAYLTDQGWPRPVSAESGNGFHLLFRVDLPNDDSSRDLIKGCLDALAIRFDDAAVKIDKSVFNAARIVKLHGTVANKGDDHPTAPWRLSKLRSVPDSVELVTVEQLRALAAEAQKPEPRKLNGHGSAGMRAWTESDVTDFLARGNIESTAPEPHDGAIRWKLKRCPFNPDHGPTESAVFLNGSGVLGFKCLHNSCQDKHWRDLRELIDGPREDRSPNHHPPDHGGRTDHDTLLEVIPPQAVWPDPLAGPAFHGLIGDIARAIEPDTESDPAAILLQVIVALGSLIGRGPHVRVEGDQHHLNMFALLVGDSSKARKGTSWSRVRELFSQIRTQWPRVVNGLSSGEGLKYNVRDPVIKLEKDKKTGHMEEVQADSGIDDKRLLVVESEFAQVLRQGARAGNTLSATIRAAWDTGDLMTLTKNDPVTATGAHISVVGHITIDELRAELTATDSANGFANRFLFMVVKRSKLLPFGGNALSAEVVRTLVDRITRCVERARGLTAVGMSASARQIWAGVYPRLSQGHPGLLGAVTARAEAQCIRLALAYALADESDVIDAAHLLAAISVWERSEASARHIFGSALGDRVADEINRALKAAGAQGVTRTEISALFKRHESAERIGAALDLLARRGVAQRHQGPGHGGRPAEVWRATNCEIRERSERTV